MAHNDTICFGDFDPVTGSPTIDGFTGIGDDGVITNEYEAGYVKGDRLTFGSGATTPVVYGSGSGFPPAVFQGVRNGDFLNLAFFCRFDLGFDPEDVIVIAVKPSPGASQTEARRIDIFPLYLDLGADDKNLATGGPAGDPDTPPASIGTPPGQDFHVRTNKPAQSAIHYRGQTVPGQPWTTLNPSGTTYSPANIDIKVRSWLPPVATLTQSVGVQTVPASPSTFTFNVVNASGFPPQGAFVAGSTTGSSIIIRYFGKSGNSLTGCSTSMGATIAAGSPVRLFDGGWSIEVALPLYSTVMEGPDVGGGADWIDIPDSFGLYFNIIRVGSGPLAQSSQGFYATQFCFPFGAGGEITGVLDATTSIPSYGTGLIPALQTPPNHDLGLGIRFVGGELGVGVRDLSAVPMSALGTSIHNSASALADNRLVARIENTGTTSAYDATGIRAEFRFANWGLGAGNFTSWKPAIGATADYPATGISLAHGGTAEVTYAWNKSAVPAEYAPPHDHQCMWVQLTSTGVNPVNFLESSVRRNMDFVTMSEVNRPAEISGVGYPLPPNGASDHEFLLFTTVREIRQQNSYGLKSAAAANPKEDTVRWLWINHGYRRTGKNIKIGNKSFEILDDTPGSFGFVADHAGASDWFRYEFSGGGIQNLGGNIHSIKVPHNGSVWIDTTVKSIPPETVSPVTVPVASGGIRWWVWVLFLFIILLMIKIFS